MTSVETKKKIEVPASAAVLFIIGCLVILCGVIAGFSIGVDRWGRVTAAAFIYWIGGVISGTLFISLGKIIELLTAIANKDYVIVNEIKTEENVDKQITVDSEKVVEKEIEEKKTIPEVVTGDLQEFFNKAVSMEKCVK